MSAIDSGQARDLEAWVQDKLHRERAKANAYKIVQFPVRQPVMSREEEWFWKLDQFLRKIRFGPVVVGLAVGYILAQLLRWWLG